LLGAGAGAWAGAYAAQRIAARAKAREEMLTEVVRVNAAITVAASITNVTLGLKKQHVATLWQQYLNDKGHVAEYKRRKDNGLAQNEIPPQCVFDLRTLDSPKFATGVLLTLIFEKMTPSSKIIVSGNTLVSSTHTLIELIQKRNIWIEQFKATPLSEQDRGILYFGLETLNGHKDETYPSFVDNIYKTTDDCIFFSTFLIAALAAYGHNIRNNYLLKYGDDAKEIAEANFNLPENREFLPDEKAYKSWLSGFVDPPLKLTWRQKLRKRVACLWIASLPSRTS
jgi:hypothetical protein